MKWRTITIHWPLELRESISRVQIGAQKRHGKCPPVSREIETAVTATAVTLTGIIAITIITHHHQCRKSIEDDGDGDDCAKKKRGGGEAYPLLGVTVPGIARCPSARSSIVGHDQFVTPAPISQKKRRRKST